MEYPAFGLWVKEMSQFFLRWLTLLFLCILFIGVHISELWAEKSGTGLELLTGKITNAKTQEPVSEAQVIIQGQDKVHTTNPSGEFSFRLAPGTYQLIINHPQYVTKMIPRAQTSPDTPKPLKIAIEPVYKLDKLVVSSTQMAGSLSAFMEEERAAPNVVDVLSAEQMSRAGDSNIAQALRRVSGLTLVDDKFVYVRGMGERYSSVLLNGARLPSTDPNRRVIEMDLIPTGIMEGAVVQKSYSADMPASFGGGTINMRTKSAPDEFTASLATSIGYSPGTTFEDGYTYDGGDYDYLGYDDGTRELPGKVPGKKLSFGMGPEELQEIGRSFTDVYDVEEENIPPDMSVSFDIGDSFSPEDSSVEYGYTAGFKYDQGWSTRDDEKFRKLNFGLDGAEIGDSCDYNWTERDIVTEGFLSLDADFNERQKFNSTTLYIQNTSDTARRDECYVDDEDSDMVQETLSWVERSLFLEQISGTHEFEDEFPFNLDWQLTYGQSEWYVPDERITNYYADSETLEWALFGGYGQDTRNFKEMEDENLDFSLDLTFPLPIDHFRKTSFQTGAKLTRKERTSQIRRFRYSSVDSDKAFDLISNEESKEAILLDENISPDLFEIRETSQANDSYSADQSVKAVYGLLDVRLNDWLGLTGGLRLENADIGVDTFELSGKAISSVLETEDVVPSIAATWFLGGGDSTKLRLGYSQTLNRPDFKELSRAPFYDPVTKRIIRGNPFLAQAEITNYDLRFEHFFSQNENISFSLFYKDFKSPIEKVQIESVQEERSYINAQKAELYGFEVEGLKDLRFIHDSLYNFYVSANFAYIESESIVNPDDDTQYEIDLTNNKHQLQGQPEYSYNITLGYENQDWGTVANLLVHGQGEQVDALGTEGLDDQYKNPFTTVDFNISQKLGQRWKWTFEAENLTDETYEFEQNGINVRSYTKGRTFTLGVEYTF